MSPLSQFKSTKFLFSKQDGLLTQYQKIVSEHYRRELDIELDKPGSNWNIQTIKQSGDSLIALQNNCVVGGAMLYKSRGNSHQLLPLESKRPLLQESYGFNLKDTPYCEVGRLAIRRENRSMPLVTNLIYHVVKQSFQQGMHYLFVLAPKANAVLYRRVCNKLGIKINLDGFAIDNLPKLYQHLDFRLICVDLLANRQTLS